MGTGGHDSINVNGAIGALHISTGQAAPSPSYRWSAVVIIGHHW
jgi:hypothetical protein